MKSNYRLLGPYIREINLRNTEGKEENLLGVSTNKVFIQSIANTVGTNFKKYKIVNQHQFTYVPDTSRRGDRIGIALLEDYQEALVSSAYTVFEITNHDELFPEYLMMWFYRKEFDRNAWFYTDADVRGGLHWDAFCNMELPVPDIEKQKAIVKEYNTIVNRIKLNEDLNKKLENTAQAIYKQWLVDFEFPDENGKLYKSNGGEMVFNEVLEKEIPVRWEVKAFTQVIDLKGGGTPSTVVDNYWNGSIPFFTPADVNQSFYTITTEKCISQAGLLNCSSRLYPKNTVFVTARGTVGSVAIAGKEMAMNQSCYAISGRENFNQFFIHQLTLSTIGKLKKEAIGAVFNALVTKDFDEQLAIKPTVEVVKLFGERTNSIYNLLLSHGNQYILLHNMSRTLLSKMANG